MFKVEPDSIHLLKEFDNKVLFPGPSGRFNPIQLDGSFTYEVLGDEIVIGRARDSAQPFGAYSSPQAVQSSLPRPPHPPHAIGSKITKHQQPKVQKTIALVTLSYPESHKPSSSKALIYTVVTQTQVSIDSTSSNPKDVSSLVSGQVGFEVVFLDSKCYPILHNDATTVLEYWKSTQAKYSATLWILFLKLTMSHLHLSVGTIQRTSLIKLNKCKQVLHLNKCKQQVQVQASIDRLAKKFDFLTSFGKTFECIICRGICKNPVVAGCCRRVIGCEACVSRWATQNSTCPLCLCELRQRWQLKGLDDTLLLATHLCKDKDLPQLPHLPPDKEHADSSDSDFEPPPPIRFRRS